jgi:hypothetical protein
LQIAGHPRIIEIAALMLVGPSDADPARLPDQLESLRVEPAIRTLVLVNDSPLQRNLVAPLDTGDLRVVQLAHPVRGDGVAVYDRIAAATLLGLRWIADNTRADVAMKIDTDALVIAPFAHKLTAATAADASIGLLGSYDRDCEGNARDFGSWVVPCQRLGNTVQRRGLAFAGRGRRVRDIVRDARKQGYGWGEHALGCAIAIPRPTLDAMRRDLDDPCLFVGTGLCDDPVVGILVRRAGFRMANDTGEGGTFAVKWSGLADTPQRLLERGYSIVHSVKNDEALVEAEIRAYYRGVREGGVDVGA